MEEEQKKVEEEQKKANEQYFRNVLSLIEDGGIYAYPHIAEVYIVRGGVFYGTEQGVKEMKEITPKCFHKQIKVEE